MNSIYLLRHCEYNNPLNILPGRLPVELSPEGKNNAVRLAEYFADKNIGRIYSSAVERCKETSAIISDQKIPIVYDKRILETLSAYQGYWGKNMHEVGYHFFSHRDELGGENLEDIKIRMTDFWNEITAGLRENIIICSHGDPLQVLFSYINNQPIVAGNAKEENIPGWMEKGEFIEIVWDSKLVEAKLKRQI